MKTNILTGHLRTVVLSLLLLAGSAAKAQFGYTTNNGGITITNYTGPGGVVVIPSEINNLPVTAIGYQAFAGNLTLSNVTIPDSVTDIGENAFIYCYNLTNATISDTASIEPGAFWDCSSLTNVTIPDGVTSIGSGAFEDCESLTQIEIPPSVTNIDADSFGECTRLTAITVDEENPSYASVDGVLFDKNINTLIQFPGGLGGDYSIPSSVTSIGGAAFEFCFGLTGVTIPDHVTTIGDGAFDACDSLGMVTLPASVTTLGQVPFDQCTGLTNIVVSPQNLFYSSSGGFLFDKYQTTLIEAPGGFTGSYTIPGGVTTISNAAFLECNLTSLTIPGSVSSLGSSLLSDCYGLTTVTLGDGVRDIGDYMFVDCYNLNRVSIPESVTYVGAAAFWNCYSLGAVYFEGNAPFFGIAYEVPSFTPIYTFQNDSLAVSYYLPGATGWGSEAGGDGRTEELTAISISAEPTNGFTPLTVNFASAGVDANGHAVTNRTWHFGDGSESTAQNPSYTYPTAGAFSAALVETDGNGFPVAGYVRSVSVAPLTVQFTATPTYGAIPLTVNFSAPGVDNLGHDITVWNWDFGDGSTSTAPNPSHIYTTPGPFTATLTATNSDGSEVVGNGPSSIYVTIPPVYLGLVLDGGFETGYFTGWTLNGATGRSSVDDGSQTGITPYPGSDEAVLSTSGSPGYFSQTLSTTPGASYLVSFWVDNPDEDPASLQVSWNGTNLFDTTNLVATDWTHLEFLATATGPTTVLQIGYEDDLNYFVIDAIDVESNFVQFSATPLFGAPPMNVKFSSAPVDHAGHSITGWTWNFGDETTASNQSPSHVYAEAGLFQPVLMATNDAGQAVPGFGPSSIAAADGLTYSGLVLNGGFETGDFTGWNLTGESDELTVSDGISWGILPYAGDYDAILLTYGATASLSQTLPTTAGSNYLISFWVNNTFDDPVTLQVLWNGTNLFETTNLIADDWTQMEFVATATGTNTVLQFNCNDPFNYFALDAVDVESNFVQFSANPTVGEPPLNVHFTSASTDNAGHSLVGWTWNFGDGTNGGTQNPSHTYGDPGIFEPVLMATNSAGAAIPGYGPISITSIPGLSYSGLVLNGGFETGDFTGWSLSGETDDLFVDNGGDSGITPYSGNYEAALATFGSIGSLSQTLPTTPGSNYLILFWVDNPFEDPATLQVLWNGTNLFDTTNLNAPGWTPFEFVATATGSNTVLQFNYEDDYDFILLDAVDVETNFVRFIANPTTGVPLLDVQFTADSQDSAGQAITGWNWSFGDGATSFAQNTFHLYTQTGAYLLALDAINALGQTVHGFGPAEILLTNGLTYFGLVLNGGFATADFTGWNLAGDTNYIFVDNGNQSGITPYPGSDEAIFETSGSPGEISQTLSTSAGATYLISFWVDNPFEDPVTLKVSWNGTNLFDTTNLVATNWIHLEFMASATGPTTVLQFEYEDDDDYFALDAIDVESNFVQFSGTPVAGEPPLTVQFTSAASDNAGRAITSWNWNFGDGSGSSAQNPSHVYEAPGIFQPALIAATGTGAIVPGFGPSSVTVAPGLVYSGLVLNDGFETGDFTGWNLCGGDTGDNFVDNGSESGLAPYAGSYLAVLGSEGSLGYLCQTIATTPGTNYALSLWLDSPDGQTPNEFLVSWNGTTVFDETNIPAIGWTNLQFLVPSTGLDAILKFGFRNDTSYLGLDAVTIGAPRLDIASFSVSGNNLTFNGLYGISGRTYRILTSTNLTLPLSQWTPVITNSLSASGSFSIAVTNAVSGNTPHMFYILQQQ